MGAAVLPVGRKEKCGGEVVDNFEINPEFQKAIPPLMPDELDQLEKNIVEDGEIRDPLVIWGNTIVDGHNRWSIIQKYPDIPYTTKQKDFKDEDDAIGWICRNQIGRRNLSLNQMSAVRAIAYNAAVGGYGGDRRSEEFSSGNSCHLKDEENVRDKIAKDFGVSSRTIQNDVEMLEGMEAAEEISPGFRDKVMAGNIKAPKQTLASIDDIPEEKREEVVKLIETGDQQYDDKLRNIDKANAIIKKELDQREEEDAIENDPVYAEYPNDYDDVLGADSSELLEAFRKCMEDAYDILESTPQYDYLLTDEGYGIALSKVNEVAEKLKSLKRETL